MLYFRTRKILSESADKWMAANGVSRNTEGVIAFLVSEGLLDEEKCRQFQIEEEVKK